MALTIQAEPVPLRVTPEGDVRIGATRVLLDLVVHAFDEGATPEAIIQRYPSLSLADVYAAIAYLLRHRAEVDAYLQERERRAEEVRRKIEADQEGTEAICERLLARREANLPL
jgi:uncharacterized protein (DUF433 family)